MNDDLTVWYQLLDGISVEVYKADVPEGENGNYVLIRQEERFDSNNKSSLAEDVVLITDVVTFFTNNVDTTVAEGIHHEVYERIMPTSRGAVLSTSGIQILNINKETTTPVHETDESENKVYRLVSRYRYRRLKN